MYEYFLGQFALAEGKKGGQFYTPTTVVRLLVEMLEPFEGRVFDPCCGSGGMFVQSEKFVKAHQDFYKKKQNGLSLKPEDRISIYGQESNQTTWKLAKMNLAIRHIDSTNVKWNNEGSFLNDAHKDLKADYVLANPPFNDSDWSGELMRDDARWNVWGEKLIPPPANANYAWILHFLYHLAPKGRAGFVLANSSLNSPEMAEAETRKSLVRHGVVDCIVDLPPQLFSNTQIKACLWFLDRAKTDGLSHGDNKEILFVDASAMATLVGRKHRELNEQNIRRISQTYRRWRSGEKGYENVEGFCRTVSIAEVEENDFVLSPSRYVSPIRSDIKIEHSLDKDSTRQQLDSIAQKINTSLMNVLKKSVSQTDWIPLSQIEGLMKLSSELARLSNSVFRDCIKRYFLDHRLPLPGAGEVDSEIGLIPEGWFVQSFSEIFTERTIRVREIGFCPAIFSVTNLGIHAREVKYSKELSKSVHGYKVAYRGDMVFGLSREIPNLDVFWEDEGAFSPAYVIYAPQDIRLGLIIGTIMRLKLMEQTDILRGGAREGRTLDKRKLERKLFAVPPKEVLDRMWAEINGAK